MPKHDPLKKRDDPASEMAQLLRSDAVVERPKVSSKAIGQKPPEPAATEEFEPATVKFFKRENGWGFLVRPGKRDAFIHARVLERDKIGPIYVGQSLLVVVVESPHRCQVTKARLS